MKMLKYNKGDWYGISIYFGISAIYMAIQQDIIFTVIFALLCQISFTRGYNK